jgi:hypothetical protein
MNASRWLCVENVEPYVLGKGSTVSPGGPRKTPARTRGPRKGAQLSHIPPLMRVRRRGNDP